MPLDSRKIAHIQGNLAKIFAGRTQPVTLTMRKSDGTTTTLTCNPIWRVMGDYDPTIEGPQNTISHYGAASDVQAVFRASEVTLAQLRSCLWAVPADTSNSTSSKYTLISVEAASMLPGASTTRYFTKWTRQH